MNPSPPDPQTVDFVVMIIVFGSIAIGLISMSIGKAVEWWDAIQAALRNRCVNRFQPVMSPALAQMPADKQTDEPDRPADNGLSEADQWLDRLEVDRTRTAIIELMVYSGWATGEIRAIIKGDNGAIGAEVEAAKKRLGIVDEPRQLRVKDEKGERLIPMEAP